MPWDPNDYPAWLRSSVPESEVDLPQEASGISLRSLVLDLADKPTMPRPVLDFLSDFAAHRGADPDRAGFMDFLEEVWPSGVPATVYASNIGDDPSAPAHLRNLLLRPICEGPLVALPAIGGLTLGLQVYRRKGKLAARRIEVTPHVPLRDFEIRVSAPIIWHDDEAYMEAQDFDALAGLPFHRAQTRARLTEWRAYLDWKKRLAEANKITVPYMAWRWEDESVLAFLVREDALPDRGLNGVGLGATPSPVQEDDADDEDDDDTTRRRPRRRPRDPEVTRLGEVDKVVQINPRDARDRDAWGDLKLSQKHRCVRIRTDEETAEALRRRGPPEIGLLVSSIAGDLATIHNQKGGVDRLNYSQGFSPRLADFIFSSTNASVPLEIPDLPALDVVADARALNSGQREAVTKALAAPDLCLIQGPPGTGKTTVIAEICLRATREGKRVLVASQANLAVDNALARLADVPWVRPLRLGDPGRVDEEFRDFLSENVVDRWFSTIAAHCRNRMRSAEQREAALGDQERGAEEMDRALAEHARCAQASRLAREKVATTDRERSDKQTALQKARQKAEDLARRSELLDALVQWAGGRGVLPPMNAAADWPMEIALPAGLDPALPVMAALEAARARREPLKGVRLAVETARAGAVSDVGAAEELRALRTEKQGLIDSDLDADMRRLREVNRRIKALEGGGWNKLTGSLHRAASAAWPGGAPACVATAVDALKPSSTTDDALDEARALVEAELAAAERAADAVAASAPHWVARREHVEIDLAAARLRVAEAERGLVDVEDRLDRAVAVQREAAATLQAAQERWQRAWRAVWPDSEPEPPCVRAVDLAQQMAATARAAHAEGIARASRWRLVQAEWVERLGQATDSDREQLQALYVRHSNVVGMTCNEAGKRNTWQDPEFKPFDIVIVDEVSKATPPELILPLLLGEKAVLVGDHRQLPPMFREREASFGEAAEMGEVSKEDFERYRRMVTASLFEELFEQAPHQIKAMLWTQYRMHPRIMDAVNQFYEGRLEAGPDRDKLSTARVHYLTVPDANDGRLISPNQHLLWIDTSAGPDGKRVWEAQQGTSKVNWIEIDVVVCLLIRLGQALASRGYGRAREVAVTGADVGLSWEDVVRRALPTLPPETLTDLFEERRVRVDGRAQKPGGNARAGATLAIRAQKEVGVITFYGAQLRELRRAIDRARQKYAEAFASIEIRTDTVDRFQGMEKPIVIASLVRATRGRLGNFVREYQRINVGLSRAQQLLVVVGAEETWKHAEIPLPPLDGGPTMDVPAYRNILELARQAGGRRLARQVFLR